MTSISAPACLTAASVRLALAPGSTADGVLLLARAGQEVASMTYTSAVVVANAATMELELVARILRVLVVKIWPFLSQTTD